MNRICSSTYSRKMGNAQYANVLSAPSGTFVSSLSSALMLVSRGSSSNGSIGPTIRPVRK
jgi:hypothetical protein